MVLYINCANHAPGVKFGQAPGVDSLHRLTMGKKNKKSSSLKPQGPQLRINCASHAPGVKFGHAPGVDSFHRLTIGKTKKSSSLKPQGPELQYFVCSNVW